ncbi:MAG TPA: efflux RND transporter permease subunit [Polyangia bacterium]|nr:efflux RND transporter permease subunit [Polyangia bacterium]
MIARLVGWSARHPRLIALASLLVVAAGLTARRRLSRDVVPDLSDPQVVVLVDWMGHAAAEVDRSVTQVMTRTLDGVPGARAVRGTTMTGMAYLEIVFGSEAEMAAGRPEIQSRLAALRGTLPPTARVLMGPDASSTGWVFQYAVVDPGHRLPLRGLRRLQDDVIRPRLAAVPGVAEVASVGGTALELFVEVRPDALAGRGVAFADVATAVAAATARPGARLADLPLLPLPAARGDGRPARLADVAELHVTDGMPTGMADVDGTLVAVGGVVIARRHADLTQVVGRVRGVLGELQSVLPPGVRTEVVYDRLDLAREVDRTLVRTLVEEIAVVVAVVLLFLSSARSALPPALMLALVLLFTFAAMWAFSIPATIVSLGGIAIAVGVAVDAEVVALDACHRALGRVGPAAPVEQRRAAVLEASRAFGPAILTALLITALTFLPALGFPGEMGRLLRPLIFTKTAVVLAAALATVTVGPVLRRRLLTRAVGAELDQPLTRVLMRVYRPFARLALARPGITLLTAALAVASCLPLLPRLGGEFLPPISEGDLLFMPTTRAGVDPDEAIVDLRWQDRTLAAFPEVASVFGKVGRADSATDPAPFSMAEATIRLRPRTAWPAVAQARWYSGWAPAPLRRVLGLLWPEERRETSGELVGKLDRAVRLPGWWNGWTAPARNRVDMMSTGIRTPVGIRIAAPEPARREALANAVRRLVLPLAGTRNAALGWTDSETELAFAPDPAALERFGVEARLAQSTADLFIAGGQVGDVDDRGQQLRVRVLPPVGVRGRADLLRQLTVRGTNATGPVPLGLLGRVRTASRPSALRTEHGQAVAYVLVDLTDGTDPRRWVAAARDLLAQAQLALQPGEAITWAGQWSLLAAGERRLAWIAPAIVLSMALLLALLLGSLTEAFIVLAAVPFALVGSVWMLHLTGYSLSAPVWAGLLLVVGLAMQTAVVMVVYLDGAFHRWVREGRVHTRADIVAAHLEGSVERLRPKVMTVVTMTASLLPLLWSDGAGADVMRRIAVPMVGGLCTSAVLTLEVLPVLYTIWRASQLRRADRLGVPIALLLRRGTGHAAGENSRRSSSPTAAGS